MTAQPSFKVCDVRRLIRTARLEGMPVERMGLVVENGRLTLLPAGSGPASQDADLDDELRQWRERDRG